MALYDPADGAWVNVIVPGYGACKTRLGASSRFTPDSKQLDFLKKRLSGSLWIRHATIESPAVLMALPTLVTSGLRSLVLLGAETPAQLDLSSLCIVCLELQDLCISQFNVMVSAHEASLRRWPIRTIELRECTGNLGDLTGSLRNPTLRMAQQLVKLLVANRQIEGSDEEEAREFRAHDGEFLPVTKERFPVESKAAMISAATSASSATKPIHRLDAHILSLIFVFASTPEQRSVVCWFNFSEE